MGLENLNPADYGVVGLALFGFIIIIRDLIAVFKDKFSTKPAEKTCNNNNRCSEELAAIIQGNTEAIAENTKTNQETQTMIKVYMEVQNTKMDEVLSKTRQGATI